MLGSNCRSKYAIAWNGQETSSSSKEHWYPANVAELDPDARPGVPVGMPRAILLRRMVNIGFRGTMLYQEVEGERSSIDGSQQPRGVGL